MELLKNKPSSPEKKVPAPIPAVPISKKAIIGDANKPGGLLRDVVVFGVLSFFFNAIGRVASLSNLGTAHANKVMGMRLNAVENDVRRCFSHCSFVVYI